MSIEDCQNCFFATFHHILFLKGPVLVRKILVVRPGPEGPQFARSVGTLAHITMTMTEKARYVHTMSPLKR